MDIVLDEYLEKHSLFLHESLAISTCHHFNLDLDIIDAFIFYSISIKKVPCFLLIFLAIVLVRVFSLKIDIFFHHLKVLYIIVSSESDALVHKSRIACIFYLLHLDPRLRSFLIFRSR